MLSPNPAASETWTALREDPCGAWLAVAHNPVVVAHETLDAGPRTVLAPATAGVAAILSSSLADGGTLAAAVGRWGWWWRRRPTTSIWRARAGSRRSPPPSSATSRACRGSPTPGWSPSGARPVRDRFFVVAAPTVAAGPDTGTLPARILAGRAARLARAVRDRLPPDASEAELTAAFEQASGAFLPGGPSGAVRLTPTRVAGKLQVDVELSPRLLGGALSLSFEL